MPDPIIRVENLGKKYRIQHRDAGPRYRALRDTLTDGLKAGASLFRGRRPPRQTETEEFWALKDVSFDVHEGEVVGIIGRNGAGKSTLLKILSQITEPSAGRVTLHGRVASLLEVGTGFHPELTGRENIYLNGSILGMKHEEIRRKFDEIVAFAETEKFLDTPVKRYSSGMYVRLAFAVAAHLEPEILVVDEVLAVGDTEFQKKCLGKMGDVAKEGRTVLFVSHNLAAVRSLTERSFLLDSGRLTYGGSTSSTIERYVQANNRADAALIPRGRGAHTAILGARILDSAGNPSRHYTAGQPLRLEVTFETDGASGLSLEALLLDSMGQRLAIASLHQFSGDTLPNKSGRHRTVFEILPLWLASGTYSFDVTTSVVNSNWDHYVEGAVDFDVVYSNCGGQPWDFKQSMGYGAFALAAQSRMVFKMA